MKTLWRWLGPHPIDMWISTFRGVVVGLILVGLLKLVMR
jgi:hypothetical protein